jgi:hypothetical protein
LPAGEKCEHCKKKEAMEHAQHEHKGEGDHKKHPPMSPAVHCVPRGAEPVYHAEKNAARNDQACAAAPRPSRRRRAPSRLKPARTPAKKTASANLATSIGESREGVRGGRQAEVEAKLEKLHDAFHAAMEAK